MTTREIPAGSAIFVVGAGIMGAGIAQVAAQAGHPVRLFDARAGAAAAAREKLGSTLDGLAAKGRLDRAEASAIAARVTAAGSLADARDAALVVEAIVEDAGAKRALFAELEAVVAPEAVLATNTSSISVTALAAGLQRRGRFVGMHFFNPVPLMKLVEVVSGLETEPAVAGAIEALARAWGKTPVHARSTPGFIVNRIARPYYAEAFGLLQDRAATPEQIDACLRGAGFRMGPCELMDLIGHDTNLSVTKSVWQANFGDARYAPSLVQQEMVDGGLLGRKSGRGFFAHPQAPAAAPTVATATPPAGAIVSLHGAGPVVERWAAAFDAVGLSFEREAQSRWTGLQTADGELRLTDGRTATEVAFEERVRNLAVFDRTPAAGGGAPGAALACAIAEGATAAWAAAAAEWIRVAGRTPVVVEDAPGLVVARTLAMLVNEAADAVQQGVCSEAAADLAMTLGLNWPAGPFAWLADEGAAATTALLDRLDRHHRGERYRVSPWLRRRAWTGASVA